MGDDHSHDERRAEEMTSAERAQEFRRLMDEMIKAAAGFSEESNRAYRRERWPLVTVAEMHADFTAAERLEMLQLLLADYTGDKSGRRILGKIIEEMSQGQNGS